jgi:hypothetical protein
MTMRLVALATILVLGIDAAYADKLDSGFGETTNTPTDETPIDEGPAGPDAVIAEGYDACTKILERGEDGFAEAESDGWTLTGGPEAAGTFLTSYYANKDVDGAGLVELYVMMEAYPSVTLGYCRLDIGSPLRNVVVDDVGEVTGFDGDLKDGDFGRSGVWQDSADDPATMIMANQDDGGPFFLQMTTLAPVKADATPQ